MESSFSDNLMSKIAYHVKRTVVVAASVLHVFQQHD